MGMEESRLALIMKVLFISDLPLVSVNVKSCNLRPYSSKHLGTYVALCMCALTSERPFTGHKIKLQVLSELGPQRPSYL